MKLFLNIQAISFGAVIPLILMFVLQASLLSPDAAADEPVPESHRGFWVFFTDKAGVRFDPHAFFDKKAIERRLAHNVCLHDSLDYPVRKDYLDSLAVLADKPTVVSRWLNAAHVHTHPNIAFGLESLDFVKKVQPAGIRLLPAEYNDAAMEYASVRGRDRALFIAQKEHMTAHRFTENGFDGEGVRIAVFDAGFRGVNSNKAFRHLIKNGQIVRTWDFHRNREDVFAYSVHGTMVLSAIAGIVDDGPLGIATGAEFLLARTEIFREPMTEEQYWLAAMEWADQHGADIINSSLGYVFHRYFPEQMDGSTSLVAQAAGIAAAKGILVINAAGNMGNNRHWRIIVTPADADSVLTVSALDFPSLIRAGYSSTGPTADGRKKPNVSALGTVVAAARNRLVTPSGTSFASPLVTGFAACLWQKYPAYSNMDVFRAIERSASLYPYYDYAHGHGTPQASYFFDSQVLFVTPTFDLVRGDEYIDIILREYINMHPDEKSHAEKENEYLYYQIKDAGGGIAQYFVADLEGTNKVRLPVHDFEVEQQLLVHFRGYTAGIVID